MSHLSHLKHKLSRKNSPKPSFKSYIPDRNDVVVEQNEEEKSSRSSRLSFSSILDDDDDGSRPSSFLQDNGLKTLDDISQQEPSYLPGEVIICRADKIMRYVPYSDCHQGVLGSIIVTNFRIVFIPVKRNSGIEMLNKVRQHLLHDEDDILLNNIECAYHVSKSRRKKLVAGRHSERINKIEIYCKDFRIHQFNFETGKQDEAYKVTNAIAHFSFPDKLDLQFAFSYKGDVQADESSGPLPDFTSCQGWEAELKRLGAKSFRATDANTHFIESQFMPMCFVVPSTVTNDRLRNDVKIYEDYRVPVWSYTHTNGASLFRMTFPVVTCPNPELVEKDLEETMRRNHPERKKPFVLDVHEPFPVLSGSEEEEQLKLPSLKEMRQSHEKLREICMPVSVKDLENMDISWYSSLASTKWVTYVAVCLKVSVRIAQILTGQWTGLPKKYRRVSVLIKEHDGARDLAPILASLVQLLLDPDSRSLHGFQSLIEKEWVVMGHRFKDRYQLVTVNDGEERQCPVFLFFLDCVHQLLKQFPKSFEFSEYYLISLWDSVCSGLYSNFIFNCPHEMISEINHDDGFSKLGDKTLTRSLLNVWDLSKQYSQSDLSLFKNPAYKISGADVRKTGPDGRESPRRKIKLLAKYYKEKPTDSFLDLDPDGNADLVSNQLYPEIYLCKLNFWSGCFLRWLTPIQVIGGGMDIEYVLESQLYEEVKLMQKKIEEMQQMEDASVSVSDFTPFWVNKRQILDSITSSFPFSPSRPTTRVLFFGTPIKLCKDDLTASSSSDLESSISIEDVCSSPRTLTL